MLTVTCKTNIEALEDIDFSIAARRKAGAEAARVGLEYMKEHAPVKTGQLRASWHYGRTRESADHPTRNPKGFRVNRLTFRIVLENTAHEDRKKGPKYYMPYQEYGFYHIWQKKYHPGHHDRIEAAKLSAVAIRNVLVSDLNKTLAEKAKAPKKEVI